MAESDKSQQAGGLQDAEAAPTSSDNPAYFNESPPPYQPTYGAADAAPPDYEAAHDPTDLPPSYESIFGQVRAAKRDSSHIGDFFKKFMIILLGTIGCTICVGLVIAIPVSMIVMGSKYLYDCPVERYIPIYLIVGGCFGVLKNLSSFAQRMKNRQEERNDENAKTNPFDSLISCFLGVWFIAGNIWIYRTYNKWSDDPTDDDYCNPTLYWYAFWLTTSMYIIMGVVCICICCGGLLAVVVEDRETNQS